ncbi:MAG TPA: ATP-binding protein, partial [Polyangiaceae bacterium]|nr:ATP-binding protein [Polyangiaceae bacterium]
MAPVLSDGPLGLESNKVPPSESSRSGAGNSSEEFSHAVYAVPFGRYEGAKPVEGRGSEVLIGRERERARMLDWLFTHGSRGAYLVTGYRGVGKTSFVNFCLRQYDDDIYGRWLQSSAGRALFWDRLAVTGFFLAVPLSLLFASQLADILCALGQIGASPVSLVRWGLVGLLTLSALYPFAHAISTARVAMRVAVPPDEKAAQTVGDDAPDSKNEKRDATANARRQRQSGYRRRLWVGFLGTAMPVLFLPLFRDPTNATAFFIALLTWTHAVCHATAISGERQLARSPASAGFSVCPPSSRSWAIIMSAVGAAVLFSLSLRWQGLQLLSLYWVIASASVTASFALRWYDSKQLVGFIKRLERGELEQWKDLREVLTARHSWGIYPTQLLLFAFVWAYHDELASNLVVLGLADAAVVAVVGGVGLWRRRRAPSAVPASEGGAATEIKPWFAFYPLPHLLMALRSLFAIALGVQVAPAIVELARLRFLRSVSASLVAPGGFLFAPSGCTSLPTSLTAAARCHQRFGSAGEEVLWLLLVAIFASCLMYAEHDWVIRRHARARRDSASDPEPSDDGKYAGAETRMELSVKTRELARATLFYSIFRTWLPLLTVRVNLGFDDLNHSHVVTSMLVGLRNEFHRVYVSQRSRLGFLSSVVSVTAVALVALVAGEQLEMLRSPWSDDLRRVPAFALTLADERDQRDHLLTHLLPYGPLSSVSGRWDERPTRLYLYWHQLAAFGLLFALARTFRGRINPLRKIHARLNAIAESTTSKIRRAEANARLRMSAPGVGLDASDRTAESETAPLEPRAIEQTFLDLLRDMLEPHVALALEGHVISLPTPQITFIFDELDKVGVRSLDNLDEQAATRGSASADHERSRRVHRLLADMKNLLSVAPARFIFVGGRDLHDEWLADQTARQPLLSNIFDAEIYLQTLLTDRLGGNPSRRPCLTSGVDTYLAVQRERANALNDRWDKWRLGPQLFDVGRSTPEHYFRQKLAPVDAGVFDAWPLYNANSWDGDGSDSLSFGAELLRHFSQ